MSMLPTVAPVPEASLSIQFPDQFVVPLLLANEALLMLSSTVLLFVGNDTRPPLLPLVWSQARMVIALETVPL